MPTSNAGRGGIPMRWRPRGLRKVAPVVFGLALLLVSAVSLPRGLEDTSAAFGVNTSFGAASARSTTTLSVSSKTVPGTGDLLVATIQLRGAAVSGCASTRLRR